MNTSNYLATTYWVIGVNILFMGATLWLLQLGGANRTVRWVFGAVSASWIFFIHVLLSQKLLIPTNISAHAFYMLTLGSAAVALTILYYSPIKRAFDHISQDNIQIVQGLRVFVASGFLMEGVLGVIPPWFSIMDGFMHVLSGFLALLAAVAVAKNKVFKGKLLWLANIVGIADIVIIVTSICFAVWNDIGPFHNMQYVVFYTGVLLLWFHFVSISKLLNSNQ